MTYHIGTFTSLIGDGRVAVFATVVSENRKTGDMIQVSYLNADTHPVEAVRSGADEANCGSCSLRGIKNRRCYVALSHGPSNIYRSFMAGNIKTVGPEVIRRLNRRKPIRFGSYGDPCCVPIDVLKDMIHPDGSWTGYTHQWRDERFAPFRSYLMASCDTREDWDEAGRLGWRRYYADMTASRLTDSGRFGGAVRCPAEGSSGVVQCVDCGLCDGVGRHRPDVVIAPHGGHFVMLSINKMR